MYHLQAIMWHRPRLAHPGPLMLAIHCAVRSCRSSLSSLPATSLLWAAPLASGEMTPFLESRHWAWAAPVLTDDYAELSFQLCSTRQCTAVLLQRWATLLASIFLKGVDQEILPCGRGRIDSVKINLSLLMMSEWQILADLHICQKIRQIWSDLT